MKWRVLLVDDHNVVRDGIRLLLESQPDMTVVGEESDGERGWRAVRELQPHVLVLDVSLPSLGGALICERVRTVCPGVRVLALSAYSDSAHVRALREAGAHGYVLKSAAAQVLTDAIRVVASGGTYFDPVLLEQMSREETQDNTADSLLSPREIEIVKLVAWGHSNKEIAALLHLSVKTVEGYKARLMEKLGLASRVELVRYALKRGWMEE